MLDHQEKTNFSIASFKEYLKTTILGHNIIYLPAVESTNRIAKHWFSCCHIEALVIITDYQWKGYGQYQRHWLSEAYCNLTFSIVLYSSILPNNDHPSFSSYNFISVLCALSVITALKKYYSSLPLRIKWPNDIMIGRKKFGGIITEATYQNTLNKKIIIGLGLNVFQMNFVTKLTQKACSLAQWIPINSTFFLSREKLLADILSQIEFYYQRWKEQDKNLYNEINTLLLDKGHSLQPTIKNMPYRNKLFFWGLNDKGKLVFTSPTNQELLFLEPHNVNLYSST